MGAKRTCELVNLDPLLVPTNLFHPFLVLKKTNKRGNHLKKWRLFIEKWDERSK